LIEICEPAQAAKPTSGAPPVYLRSRPSYAARGLIESILDQVAGVDIVMVASNDFGQFAGDRDGTPSYNAREKLVRESVLAHGKILAGPSSWHNRPGYMLFQGPKSAKATGYEKL
jgi:hypothetical protein